MKKLYILMLLPLLIGCNSNTNVENRNSDSLNGQLGNDSSPTLINRSIHRDDEFGGAYIDISIPDFNALGFQYGDSVNLTFDNGAYKVIYEDIGYYSGYYVPAGQELLVAYPSYPYIKFCINYGEDIYTMHHFSVNTKVTITVNEAQKYKAVEDTLSINYSDDITTYPNKEAFANFRMMKGGQMKEGILYRGASPIDNQRKRAKTVDDLLEEHEINFIIDLADKRSKIDGIYESPDFQSYYYQTLDQEDKVVLLGMAAAYKADEFADKMKTLFLSILNNDGPYYIHCLEGKDRTGYVCMVLEALCGATYDELVEDYFITYKNYYGIEKNTERYEVIKELHIDEMIAYVFGFDGVPNLTFVNFHSMANDYMRHIGLTQEEIDQIQEKLCNE